jgi:hypothetical protein
LVIESLSGLLERMKPNQDIVVDKNGIPLLIVCQSLSS